MHPRHLPMLVKPKPWLNYNQGGYIYNKSQYLKHASSHGNVELVFAGLDVLGSTPWQINRKIFDVVLEVWNAGDCFGKLLSAVYEEPEPEKTPEMETDQKARYIYIQCQCQWLVNKANNHSDRCSVNYKIEIARTFQGDTFYLPHNLDFRGRAYPLPPHLNRIGDDLTHGLLLFGEAKPLGERGLRWLKIRMSSLYGYDKATFEERVEFVHKHLDDIFNSAVNPLNLCIRDVNGGRRRMTHGNALPPTWSSRLRSNHLMHMRTSVHSLYIKAGHVMDCSTMPR
ncbi:hypothetical protein V8E52_006509 [Russula decolorans]